MNILRIMILLIFPLIGISQAPQRINFQSVLRNTNGEVVSNRTVSLRISILSDTINGIADYVEIHTKTTDAGGLMSLQIGNGTAPSMDFTTINWGNSAHFIQLEADLSGGNNYVLLGTQELMSVPYALYASATDTSVFNLTTRFKTKLNGADTISLSDRINAKSSLSDTSLLNLITRFETKLSGTDTASLSNRINAKSSLSDTSLLNLTTRFETKLSGADTTSLSTRMNAKLSKTDTASLSDRINANLNKTDTSLLNLVSRFETKLSKVDTVSLSDRINAKLSKVDTVSLSDRINAKLSKVDTSSLSDRIDAKLTKTDTSSLSDRVDLKLTKTDTSSLSDRIDAKLTKTDTSSLSDRIDAKLTKTDTASLSNRINLKLTKTDTASLSDRIDTKLTKTDTASLSNRINAKLSKTDTSSLSDRIDLKLTKADTASLSNRIDLKLTKTDTSSLSDRIDLKLTKTDTASLSNRIDLKLTKADTSSLSDRIDLKLTKADTASLSNRIDLKLTKTDTSSLSDRIDAKLSKTDTSSLSDRIDAKLTKTDTASLSNRIDLKLTKTDTVSLSDRIDAKLSKTDTLSLSDRINAKLSSSLFPHNLGSLKGYIMYWNGSSWVLLNPGTAGQVLKMSSDNDPVPVWGTDATTSVPAFSPCGTTISDIDGNTYNTVLIGAQCWTKENLRVRRYNNGTAIPFDTTGGSGGSSSTWSNLTIGAHTIYANDSTANPSNRTKYGYLYNWYAAKGIYTTGTISSIDTGKICPSGWHVPTDAEWTTLTTELGGLSVAAGKMKSIGTAYWYSPNTGATNESGFSALPGGFRYNDGSFYDIRNYAFFWSATEKVNTIAWNRYMNSNNSIVYRNYNINSVGASVRCLRD
jgi:uncharacterized protein (TIGR02145 family)